METSSIRLDKDDLSYHPDLTEENMRKLDKHATGKWNYHEISLNVIESMSLKKQFMVLLDDDIDNYNTDNELGDGGEASDVDYDDY